MGEARKKNVIYKQDVYVIYLDLYSKSTSITIKAIVKRPVELLAGTKIL